MKSPVKGIKKARYCENVFIDYEKLHIDKRLVSRTHEELLRLKNKRANIPIF